MVEKPRALPGEFGHIILQLLRDAGRPLSAADLKDQARRDDRPVFLSEIFRHLHRLRQSGAIRKIELAKKYACGGDTRQISLFCTGCGELATVASEKTFRALDTVAASRGYRIGHYVVEVAGACPRCGEAIVSSDVV